jgi:hypothetical protein
MKRTSQNVSPLNANNGSVSLLANAVLQTPRPVDFATPARPLSPPASETANVKTSIDTSIVQPGGMRVLLVEDNEINMKLLVAYMRKLKLNHATAINGLEALNTYKEANGAFDVIFMGSSSFTLSQTKLPNLLYTSLTRP